MLNHPGEILSGSELAKPYGTMSQMVWREGSLVRYIPQSLHLLDLAEYTTPITQVPGGEKKMKCSDGKLRLTGTQSNTDLCSVWQEKLGKTIIEVKIRKLKV